MVILYKSCSALHKESNKIGLALFWFYKIQPKGFTIEDLVLQQGPWDFSILHRNTLGLHLNPQKDWNLRNWVQGPRERRGRPEFVGSSRALGRERCQRGGGAHHSSVRGWRSREGVEAASASSPGSAERRRPLRFGCRRGDRRGSPTSEC
jgi:hypothetical protein